MSRWAARAAIVAATTFAVLGCGEQERSIPPAQPLSARGCSPITYGGKGRPDYLIAVMTALQGQFIDHGIQTSQAIKLVLAQHGWHAGEYAVGLQVCDETSPKTDLADPARCRRDARAFVRNRSVLGVVGPLFSSCAHEMLPILNRATDGPLALISGSNTYLGLTRSGPGVARGDPEHNFPTGRRSYARVAPADDAQAAAIVVYAQRGGATKAFALNDREGYGIGLAEAFRVAAQRSGLRVVGSASWNPKARTYRGLAERIRRTGADAVFLGGYVSSNGPRLVRDLRRSLGPSVRLIGPDGFEQAAPLVEGAGDAAEGFVATIAVLPNRALPPAGQDFAAEFLKRFSQRPCCYSVHSAQATRILLDAIAASGGNRARVTAKLFGTRVDRGLIGDFSIDRYGDTTLTTIGVYRIESGDLHFVTAITPPARLLARE